MHILSKLKKDILANGDWFYNMNKEDQEEYIDLHPNSKYAKEYRKDNQKSYQNSEDVDEENISNSERYKRGITRSSRVYKLLDKLPTEQKFDYLKKVDKDKDFFAYRGAIRSLRSEFGKNQEVTDYLMDLMVQTRTPGKFSSRFDAISEGLGLDKEAAIRFTSKLGRAKSKLSRLRESKRTAESMIEKLQKSMENTNDPSLKSKYESKIQGYIAKKEQAENEISEAENQINEVKKTSIPTDYRFDHTFTKEAPKREVQEQEQKQEPRNEKSNSFKYGTSTKPSDEDIQTYKNNVKEWYEEAISDPSEDLRDCLENYKDYILKGIKKSGADITFDEVYDYAKKGMSVQDIVEQKGGKYIHDPEFAGAFTALREAGNHKSLQKEDSKKADELREEMEKEFDIE